MGTSQQLEKFNTPYKNPRPILDSSFCPYPWCFTINDWTHKDNEPPLTFAGAELGFMVWLYNLRITYPDLEIYIADDDVSGAFRLMRYHPNCMASYAHLYPRELWGSSITSNLSKVDNIIHLDKSWTKFCWRKVVPLDSIHLRDICCNGLWSLNIVHVTKKTFVDTRAQLIKSN
jgi:hypothetical protein